MSVRPFKNNSRFRTVLNENTKFFPYVLSVNFIIYDDSHETRKHRGANLYCDKLVS